MPRRVCTRHSPNGGAANEARVPTAFDVFRDYSSARFGVEHIWIELEAASYVY